MRKHLSHIIQNLISKVSTLLPEVIAPRQFVTRDVVIDTKDGISTITVHAFAQGNELAFKAIFDFYAPAIYRVACRYLGSGQLAEDLVEEVFTNFRLKRAKFVEPGEVRLYLFTSARSVATKLHRLNLCLRVGQQNNLEMSQIIKAKATKDL